jgi:hypothetical protein
MRIAVTLLPPHVHSLHGASLSVGLLYPFTVFAGGVKKVRMTGMLLPATIMTFMLLPVPLRTVPTSIVFLQHSEVSVYTVTYERHFSLRTFLFSKTEQNLF